MNRMTSWLKPSLFCLFLGSAALTGCGDDGGGEDNNTAPDAAVTESQSIVDIAVADPNFSILVEAVQKAGLVETLSGPGSFTVFAPTNAAFEASGITSVDDIEVDALREILLYHVLAAEVKAAEVQAGPVETVAELTAFVSTDSGVTLNGGNQQAGGANISATDIDADNGVIHVIDRVLLPPDIPTCASYAGLTGLVGAVGAADPLEGGISVLEALQGEGPFTVFAPTNDAFDAIAIPSDGAEVRDILLYHVLAGAVDSDAIPAKAESLLQNRWGNPISMLFQTDSGVSVNDSNVAVADVHCTNGTVHVVDKVLLPPNLVDMAGYAGFTTLAGAIGGADDIPGKPPLPIIDALQADAPYTLFAPTNAAFDAIAIPSDTAVLRDLLLLHVVQAESPVLSSGLPASADSLLSGQVLNFNASGPSVSSQGTSDAGIAMMDINVVNGVIHVVDKVLLP